MNVLQKYFFLVLILVVCCPDAAIATNFIENKGQLSYSDGSKADDVLFCSIKDNFVVFIRNAGISYVFNEYSKIDVNSLMNLSSLKSKSFRVDLEFLDANNLNNFNDNTKVRSGKPSSQYYNYYLNPNCSDGILGVREYESITIENVYDNIDLRFESSADKLKYEFIVKPEGDYEDIKLEIIGSENIEIDEQRYIITTPMGTISDNNLKVFQNDIQSTISASFVIDDNIISFDINDYDRRANLIIDPEIEWSTYSGSSKFDIIHNIASNNNYIITVGNTNSIDLPITPGVFQEYYVGKLDTYLQLITPDGEIEWITYFGGAGDEHTINLYANEKSIWFCGQSSGIVPVTNDAFQSDNKGGTADAFFAEFDYSGQRLYASMFGGAQYQAAVDIEVDSKGNVFITGRTFDEIYTTNNAKRSLAFALVPAASASAAATM